MDGKRQVLVYSFFLLSLGWKLLKIVVGKKFI